MRYEVVEKFVSINGEGMKAGEPAVFIRFKGCNLNCSYCDTKWANSIDAPCKEESLESIVEYVKATGIENVTVTGGEPLFREGMIELIEALGQVSNVEIETNGSLDIKRFVRIKKRPSITMDYKSKSSGMEEKMLLGNYKYLTMKDTVKFVVGSKKDMEKALEIINKYSLKGRVNLIFSPVFGQIESKEIVEFLLANKLNQVRMQLQLHKFIWDPEERGV